MLIEIGQSLRLRGPMWPIAFLRVVMGYYFLQSGFDKIASHFIQEQKLITILHIWAGQAPMHDWYWEHFIRPIVLPNIVLISTLVVAGELLVGLSLVSGFLVRASALFAAFMNLNYFFAMHGHGLHLNEAFVAIEIVLFVTAAGRCFGLDAILHNHFPRSHLV